MINNQIFAWGNYDDNPNKAIGVDSIPTQKSATYNSAADGVFTGNVVESFFTNVDKSLVSNPASVIGEKAMELVEGKGFVNAFVTNYITNKAEYDAAMADGGFLKEAGYDGTEWSEGMSWAVATFSLIEGTLTVFNKGEKATVLDKGTTEVTNAFPVTLKSTYFIIDKGEVQDCENVKDITFEIQ